MNKWTINQLKHLRESEDKVEFKKANQGNMPYDGGSKMKPSDRRKCILGYVVAFCNEGGGSLVLGMEDGYPHKIVGTKQNENSIGELESAIYRDVQIRPSIYELYENEEIKEGRVLVIDVPPRPVGKLFRFEDVPLMRVGEELRPMSDEMIFSILQEQEPDFSSEICKGLSYEDLDEEAIGILKRKYATKQQNPDFLTLPNRQVLSDLGLIHDSGVTYAALILAGKAEKLNSLLPQAKIVLEYRKAENLIPYTNRQEYLLPFYKMIDRLWHDINLRNDKIDVSENSYIFNIPFFNEDVIREAVNNAVAHRDYRRTGETFILQYPQKMIISNMGGFPLGVTLENLLRVQSTPRNRLLADVLAKTGIVERSGQGVDKIFRNTLLEGKEAPDYSYSDAFRVELHLSAVIKDLPFALFIEAEQRELPEEEKLSVFEVIALNSIRENPQAKIAADVLESLLRRGMIEKRGKTRAVHYVLSRSYYEFCGNEGEYTKRANWNTSQSLQVVLAHFSTFKRAKMKDFEIVLQNHMTRRQVRVVIDQFVSQGYLSKSGKGSGTYYEVNPEFIKAQEFVIKALDLGLKELQKQENQNVQEMSKEWRKEGEKT